jgi:hypothetical protein
LLKVGFIDYLDGYLGNQAYTLIYEPPEKAEKCE